MMRLLARSAALAGAFGFAPVLSTKALAQPVTGSVTMAFTGATLIDGTDRAPIGNATLQQPARMDAMRTNAGAQQYKKQLPVAMQNLKALSDAGVRIAMGTDTGPMGRFQGYFELMELEMMVEAGMTPRAVLAAATRDAARCMRIDAEPGTHAPGKWVDFVVLHANPLENMANVRKQHSVWIGGKRVGKPYA